ncbi:hypothetical protein ACNQ6O_09935 [Marinobacter sp. SBS5]|uniref:hypothetical protein n=1 Tax=Marinobacter sp. SBS5 TaxID=3401754 RepID=UPI003AABB2FA
MSSTGTRQPRPIEAGYPRIRRNRKDVLGLSETSSVDGINLLQDYQRLARKGFSVTQNEPAHWIIRGKTPLPEIHCYSESEVHQFTVNNG